MQIINCHTHTMFSHDARGSVAELCEAALKNNLSGFAVTDHCDCECAEDFIMNENLSTSFKEAEKYKKLYEGKLKLLRGVEIGEFLFNPDFAKEITASHNYDVILGSVHAVRIKNYEMPFSIIDFSRLSDEFIDEYITRYFEDLLETACNADYDILCHLTVILRYVVYKYNRSVDLSRHLNIITEILKIVISRDKTLEINTSGVRDGYFMPDKSIIELYRSLGGTRVALGSDGHTPSDIAQGLAEGVGLIKMLGFEELTYYENRRPVTYKI